jgi:methylated-DNA-protein-cysteine methyltransferase-like protein
MNVSGRNTGMHENIRRTIRMVPHGKVATYGSVARAAGYPGASRLVARVLQNSEGLPWQRILGAGGQIKLPGEAGMEQRFRLQMEGVMFRGRRVDMKLHEHRFAKRKPTQEKRSKSAALKRPRIR